MPLPDELHPGGDRLTQRPLSTGEAVQRQIDRIAFLRSMGQPWAEAVEMLRDMVVGLEDLEFWDGIPKSERQQLAGLEEAGQRKKAAELRAKCAPYGWNGVPVRAVPGAGGRPVWKPTPENLGDMLRIILRLLDRRDLLWKVRRSAELPPSLHA